MSLPSPVFRLDAQSEMPFEPLCAIAPGETAVGTDRGVGLFARLRQWLGQTRASRCCDHEAG